MALGVVRRAFEQAGTAVAAFVIRAAQDFAGAGYEQSLAWLDALGSSVDIDQLMPIADQLPKDSLALLVHGAKITTTIVDGLREKVEAGEWGRLPNLAAYSSNLAVRLGALGDKDAAVGHAHTASELFANLPKATPTTVPISPWPSTPWPQA